MDKNDIKNIDDIKNVDIDDQLDSRLNLVRYQTKKNRIREILENSNQVALNDNAIKNGRMWLVGFLNHIGYSEDSILNIIKCYNRWKDYKEEETTRQVHWLVNRKHLPISNTEQSDMRCCVVFTQANGINKQLDNFNGDNNTESNEVKSDDIIDLFFNICKPVHINPPRNINDAIIYYHSRGFHMIPKIRDEKRPAIKWKIYQENQPSLYIVKRWNFNNGIILLGTRIHSFLDIDIRSDSHDEGLENFDESRLKGWYYERTQNGGYHIFGSGFFPKGMTGLVNNAVQIKHLGGYIVAYPTSGYTKSPVLICR
jgi:hypothetical protein